MNQIQSAPRSQFRNKRERKIFTKYFQPIKKWAAEKEYINQAAQLSVIVGATGHQNADWLLSSSKLIIIAIQRECYRNIVTEVNPICDKPYGWTLPTRSFWTIYIYNISPHGDFPHGLSQLHATYLRTNDNPKKLSLHQPNIKENKIYFFFLNHKRLNSIVLLLLTLFQLPKQLGSAGKYTGYISTVG